MIHQMNMEGQGNWTSSALCQNSNQYLQMFNELMNNMLLVQMNKDSKNMIKNDEDLPRAQSARSSSFVQRRAPTALQTSTASG
jgi:hypothetical protein